MGYSAACDTCIAQNGCDAYCTCAGDSSLDDASMMPTGCVGYVDCIIACLNGDPEAGVPPADGGVPECAALCGGDGGTYTGQQQQEGQALLTALVGCQTQCQ